MRSKNLNYMLTEMPIEADFDAKVNYLLDEINDLSRNPSKIKSKVITNASSEITSNSSTQSQII